MKISTMKFFDFSLQQSCDYILLGCVCHDSVIHKSGQNDVFSFFYINIYLYTFSFLSLSKEHPVPVISLEG